MLSGSNFHKIKGRSAIQRKQLIALLIIKTFWMVVCWSLLVIIDAVPEISGRFSLPIQLIL